MSNPNPDPAGQAGPPAGSPPGQAPTGEQKTYDEKYVADLRRENAAARKARQDAETARQAAEARANAVLTAIAQAVGAAAPPPQGGQPPAPPAQPGWPPAPGWGAPPPPPTGATDEDRYQRRVFDLEVKAAAAGKAIDPADLVPYLAAQRDELCGPTGEPDARLIADAVTQLLKAKPYLAAPNGADEHQQHQQPGHQQPPPAWPGGSFDQGARTPPPPPSAWEAGQALAAARHPKPTP